MEPEEYAKMYILEATYWWFQGRLKIVSRVLNAIPAFRKGNARVLDLGCGTGLVLDHLNGRCWSVGLDFSQQALGFCRRRGIDRLLKADVQALPVSSSSVDLVTALDLAEHVENDARLFSEILRVLRPGGSLVVTAPAHPFLWSDHDDALHHFRRYKRRELRRQLEDAGFDVRRLSYCITLTFPLIVGFRCVQRCFARRSDKPKTHLIRLPKWMNRLIQASVELESLLLRWFNLPFGVTLLAVAHKPANRLNAK